jgi:hypothetical protein
MKDITQNRLRRILSNTSIKIIFANILPCKGNLYFGENINTDINAPNEGKALITDTRNAW